MTSQSTGGTTTGVGTPSASLLAPGDVGTEKEAGSACQEKENSPGQLVPFLLSSHTQGDSVPSISVTWASLLVLISRCAEGGK